MGFIFCLYFQSYKFNIIPKIQHMYVKKISQD